MRGDKPGDLDLDEPGGRPRVGLFSGDFSRSGSDVVGTTILSWAVDINDDDPINQSIDKY